jgi:hypothetical protein
VQKAIDRYGIQKPQNMAASQRPEIDVDAIAAKLGVSDSHYGSPYSYEEGSVLPKSGNEG